MFSAGGNPAEGAKLWDAGYLVDFDKALTDLGVRDKVSDGAVSTIEKLYGGAFNFLPYQYNIEGIWYNKADLRGERLGRARDVGRPPDRRRRSQGRRPHAVRRIRRAGLAPHAPGQRLHLPLARPRRACRRSPTATPS